MCKYLSKVKPKEKKNNVNKCCSSVFIIDAEQVFAPTDRNDFCFPHVQYKNCRTSIWKNFRSAETKEFNSGDFVSVFCLENILKANQRAQICKHAMCDHQNMYHKEDLKDK